MMIPAATTALRGCRRALAHAARCSYCVVNDAPARETTRAKDTKKNAQSEVRALATVRVRCYSLLMRMILLKGKRASP